jgi:hypothetical protein
MHFISPLVRPIYNFSVSIFLVGVLALSMSFGVSIQPSHADVSTPKQALEEIKKDQSAESPAQAYDEMTKVVENPKVGIEKEYEKNEQKYFQEHPDSAGLVEKAKELVTSVTEPQK